MSMHRDILLVEDEAAIADMLRRVLVRADYSVRVATNGTEALKALEECIPAVLILDLILPVVSGFSVLKHIGQQQITMPIVVITANPLHHDTLHEAGLKHVLIKPFMIEELLDALHAIVGHQHIV
jgi:DNA-binding response OmpR family regulator